MLSSPYSGPRAGFWRRVLAFSVDCLLIGAVTAVIGPLAFSVTGGRIQIGGVGVSSLSCAGVSTIPADLDPAPFEGSNHAEVCDGGTLPFVVSEHFLRVGRRTSSPGKIVDVSRTYSLTAAGVPGVATDLTWAFQLGFVAYLVVSLICRGRTVGMRVLHIRLVTLPIETPGRGVPVRRLLIRIGVAVAGFVPAAVGLGLVLLIPDGTFTGALIAAAVLLWVLWVGWNLILVARKDDPVYDSVAGLAVLVEQS